MSPLFLLCYTKRAEQLYKELKTTWHQIWPCMICSHKTLSMQNFSITLCVIFFKQRKICNLLHFAATLQSCRFKFYFLLIQLRANTFSFQSTIGHMSSCDTVWIRRAEFAKFELAFPVSLIRIHINGSQWNKKCSVTTHLLWINHQCSLF